MHFNCLEDSYMLKQSRIFFALTFAAVLLVLLTLSVEAYRVVSRHDLPPLRSGLADRLLDSTVVAVYFLVASGYLVLFMASYFLLTWRVRRWKRSAWNVLLFIASYAFLFFFMSADSISTWGIGVLVAGIASVLIADAVASSVFKPEPN